MQPNMSWFLFIEAKAAGVEERPDSCTLADMSTQWRQLRQQPGLVPWVDLSDCGKVLGTLEVFAAPAL